MSDTIFAVVEIAIFSSVGYLLGGIPGVVAGLVVWWLMIFLLRVF